MIQFNLLPDVKLEFIKAQRRKRLIAFLSFVIGGMALLIFVLLFLFVRVNQKGHLKDLDNDIKKTVASLQSNNDLNSILTVQNQLKSLPGLHDKKVFTSRLFDYLGQLTPAQASVTSVDADMEANTLLIKGEADSVVTINKFVDTIKFTKFNVAGDSPKTGNAFSKVVLQSYSIQKQTTNGDSAGATFELNMVFDPVIFANTAKEGSAVANGVSLTVPNIVTTQSETGKPGSLFKQGAQSPAPTTGVKP